MKKKFNLALDKDIFLAIDSSPNRLLKFDKEDLVRIILFLRDDRQHWINIYGFCHNEYVVLDKKYQDLLLTLNILDKKVKYLEFKLYGPEDEKE